jgi:hypothetical protein
MRKLLILLPVLLAACSPAEKEVITTSVDVDQSRLPALLQEIDSLVDNSLAVDAIVKLAEATPMDEELQDRYAVRFRGADEEMQIHVWREQVDWLHLYFSSTSKEMIAAIENKTASYARQN